MLFVVIVSAYLRRYSTVDSVLSLCVSSNATLTDPEFVVPHRARIFEDPVVFDRGVNSVLKTKESLLAALTGFRPEHTNVVLQTTATIP